MKELRFLSALWKTNLAGTMEYRIPFLSQMLGMILNNAAYFVVWVIFFDRFKQVRGWQLGDMYVVFGVAAGAFGLVSIFFGNAFNLGEIITKGRLDYYLSFPRPVLLHTLASRTIASGFGDFIYGFLSFAVSGRFSWDGLTRFVLAILLAAVVFAAFLIIVQSLAFWMGTASLLTNAAVNAMLTFALYPITLFDNTAKFMLFTIIPAALMGAVPAEFVGAFSWSSLLQLLIGASALLAVALWLFHTGLRRYESGSAIQTEV
jgi:ABC-2 type transport system permease protein